MSANVQNGDRVRVVLEGEAYGVARDGAFNVGSGRLMNCVTPHAEHVVSVEVLAKPFKVGDYVEGYDVYKKLPVSTVLDNGRGSVLVKRQDGKWLDSRYGAPFSDLGDPRAIIHLPDAS